MQHFSETDVHSSTVTLSSWMDTVKQKKSLQNCKLFSHSDLLQNKQGIKVLSSELYVTGWGTTALHGVYLFNLSAVLFVEPLKCGEDPLKYLIIYIYIYIGLYLLYIKSQNIVSYSPRWHRKVSKTEDIYLHW